MTNSQQCRSSGILSLGSGPFSTLWSISKAWKRWLPAALAWLTAALLGTSAPAFGCASCTGAIPEPIRQAYNYSTAWLSFVPLIFMGGIGYFIFRLVKRGQTEEQ